MKQYETYASHTHIHTHILEYNQELRVQNNKLNNISTQERMTKNVCSLNISNGKPIFNREEDERCKMMLLNYVLRASN